MKLNRITWTAVPLVFSSGFCALVYQIVWTREFRFVFGASTAASAAVVAIFIAGLGFGGLWLGRRTERSTAPLGFYANIELAIALSSAATPFLLGGARWLYVASGGTLSLGVAGATVVRLLLATLVLGVPTFLMGGTLPAVARAISSEDDPTRRGVALVYGANTIGAVFGCLLANFAMLEMFGARVTLWIACLLNLLVAVIARSIARGLPPVAVGEPAKTADAAPVAGAPAPEKDLPRIPVLVSAGVVGFVFFLMELVWYRMLGPLLGGTVFTFGLILAVALTGIGAGSTFYTAVLANRRPRLSAFAITCLLEAALLAVPYFFGDRIALWALMLRPLGGLGFSGFVFGWALVAGFVVFPAAFISGVQFPMLIAMLGRGREHVGRDVGIAYAANTLGAIAGALAGGFGMLPWLGAVGAWRFAVLSLTVWGGAIALAAVRNEGWQRRFALSVGLLAVVLLMVRSEGPTAAWRHSPIGAGREDPREIHSPNTERAFVNNARHNVLWEAEGVESSVALHRADGLAFVVNGKIDGNARADAATQVMSGLLGSVLQPRTRTAMVIGLGTGSTAGWLGQMPSIERIDVAEIEPAILEVARRCAPVNEDVLRNRKVHVFQGDARELLAVSRARYDVVFSEPSNPYRAGIASLYTHEFYEAVAKRLTADGVFVQWLQAYEIDAGTVRSVYATLGSVFPYVETWRGMPNDLLLIASRRPLDHDIERLQAHLAEPVIARGMRNAWSVDGVEGLFSHFVARSQFARAAHDHGIASINTDDLSMLEFGFGRTVGGGAFNVASLLATARARGDNVPTIRGGTVDWARVDFEREVAQLVNKDPSDPRLLTPEYRARYEVLAKWVAGNMRAAFEGWRLLPEAARATPTQIERLATVEILAHVAVDAGSAIDSLARERPTEAAALRAVWLLNNGHEDEALNAYEDAIRRYRRDPWPMVDTMHRALGLLARLGRARHDLIPRILTLLDRPFSAYVNDRLRVVLRLQLGTVLGAESASCVNTLAEIEPFVPWTEEILRFRVDCYRAQQKADRLERAMDDLRAFRSTSEPPFEAFLR